MNKITKEELLSSRADRLTMKDLRKFVNNNPQIKDNTPILTERVEDRYFEGIDISGMSGQKEGDKSDGWKVFLVEGYNYWNISQFNKKMQTEIENRKAGKGKYSTKLNPEENIINLTDDFKEHFFSSWCITKENDDSIVYIYNHY